MQGCMGEPRANLGLATLIGSLEDIATPQLFTLLKYNVVAAASTLSATFWSRMRTVLPAILPVAESRAAKS